MKTVALKSFILSAFFFFSLSNLVYASEHAYGGIPSGGAYVERQGYIIQFDQIHKIPRWVAYHVKPENLDTPDRSINKWRKYRDDPDIIGEATEEDYNGHFTTWQNYAVGHLAPYYISGGDRDNDGINAASGDEDDAKTVYEINYFSNMAPQHHYNFPLMDLEDSGINLRPM